MDSRSSNDSSSSEIGDGSRARRQPVRLLRTLGWLVVAVLAIPQFAGATTFGWGEITADDKIGSIHFANPGTAVYDGSNLTITDTVSSITFTNGKATISGITGVTFVTILQVSFGSVIVAPAPPFTFFMTADFTSVSGFTLVDANQPAGSQVLLDANYASSLGMTASSGAALLGELTAEFSGATGQDADFLAAFSTAFSFDSNLTFLNGTICSVVVNCTVNPFNTRKNFNASATTTLKHTPVPEPNTLTLTLLGLVGLAARRRVRNTA